MLGPCVFRGESGRLKGYPVRVSTKIAPALTLLAIIKLGLGPIIPVYYLLVRPG